MQYTHLNTIVLCNVQRFNLNRLQLLHDIQWYYQFLKILTNLPGMVMSRDPKVYRRWKGQVWQAIYPEIHSWREQGLQAPDWPALPYLRRHGSWLVDGSITMTVMSDSECAPHWSAWPQVLTHVYERWRGAGGSGHWRLRSLPELISGLTICYTWPSHLSCNLGPRVPRHHHPWKINWDLYIWLFRNW